MENIQVSVICLAYNHEKYIREALEGFVMQKTNFSYEVVIHDDASTDKTADIIREYQKKYPQIIKPIYQKENQYSQGVKILDKYIFPRIKGKYIAYCEGDDYWTDELKLQKQFDILEKHLEIDGCAHKIEKIKATDNSVQGYVTPAEKNMIIPVEQVIAGGGGFIGTNSLMYRKNILEKEYAFASMLELDYVMQIRIALRGGLFYLDDCMGVYRVLAEESWTSKMYQNKIKANEHKMKVINMLRQLDSDTEFKYHHSIEQAICVDECEIIATSGKIKDYFKEPVKAYFEKLPLKNRIRYVLRVIKNQLLCKMNN